MLKYCNYMNTNKIRNLMKARKMTRRALSETAGINGSSIDRMLDGADVRISTLLAVAQALQVPVCELLDDEPNAAPSATVTGHHNNTAVDGTLTITTGDAERVATLEQLVATQQKYITMLEQQLDVLRGSARATGVQAPASP